MKEGGSVYVVVLGPRTRFGAADELVLSFGDVAWRPQVLGPWLAWKLRCLGLVKRAGMCSSQLGMMQLTYRLSGTEYFVSLFVRGGLRRKRVEAVEADGTKFMRAISNTKNLTL